MAVLIKTLYLTFKIAERMALGILLLMQSCVSHDRSAPILDVMVKNDSTTTPSAETCRAYIFVLNRSDSALIIFGM